MTRAVRIALCGSAGTGKSTLARRLARELGLPYIAEGMRARLEAGLDLHALGREGLRALVEELWREQRDAEARATEGFVADRSSYDFAAFWLHYGLHVGREDDGAGFRAWCAHGARYERVIVLPWGVLPLAADGVRSTDPWTQLRFQAIVEGILARFAPPGQALAVSGTTDLETRVREALEGVAERAVERGA